MSPDRLPQEIAPPQALEARTVAALRREGLLRPARRGARPWLAAAAAVLLFASGVAAGRAFDAPPVAVGQPRFLLLLHGAPSVGGPEEEARVVASYRAWAAGLRADGRFVAGERLGEANVVVPAASVAGVDQIRGYFVISAEHLQDAIAVARTCPHAARGGRVIVRPIDPV